MVWENALDAFRQSIEQQGYFYYPKPFRDFVKEYKIDVHQAAPAYLSIDFWSQQRKELTQNGWYVIRLGRGTFAIFSKEEFPRPYLQLSTSQAQYLSLRPPSTFSHLEKAFKMINYKPESAEDTLLELLGFYGAYEVLAKEIDGTDEYHVGPRGNASSEFNVYLQRRNRTLEEFEYDGQVELDYSIWTENRVFVFEAKSGASSGLDIGWHKLAFPAQRFAKLVKDNGLKISPVYLLGHRERNLYMVYLFVFTQMRFHDDGVVLNNKNDWKPEMVLKIDLDLQQSHL